MLTVRLNQVLILSLSPSSARCTVLRDGEALNFDVESRAPLDVANDIKRRADTVNLSGRITLMQIICALLACNISLQQSALVAINADGGRKFSALTKALDEALAGDQNKLRYLLQQLVVPSVVISVDSSAQLKGRGGRMMPHPGEPAFQ